MRARFYTKFLNNLRGTGVRVGELQGTVGGLRGGRFSVHKGTLDGVTLTRDMSTPPRIPRVTHWMLDGLPVSLHEVDEIMSMKWYSQSRRVRSHSFLSADIKIKDEDGRTFFLTTRIDDGLKSWVQRNRCWNVRFPHLLSPDLLLIFRDILCGMRDVQLQVDSDHLNINLDTIYLVSIGGRYRAVLSHMIEATSPDAQLDGLAFDHLLSAIFGKAISSSSELQDLGKCVISRNFTIQFLLDNHPSLMDDGLARHQARAHFVRTFLEGPYILVTNARKKLENAWISYQMTLQTPFVFPKWKHALGGYSTKPLDHMNEDSLLDFIKVARNLGEHKTRGFTEAAIDTVVCKLYPEHMTHMFHVAAIAFPGYSCGKSLLLSGSGSPPPPPPPVHFRPRP